MRPVRSGRALWSSFSWSCVILSDPRNKPQPGTSPSSLPLLEVGWPGHCSATSTMRTTSFHSRSFCSCCCFRSCCSCLFRSSCPSAEPEAPLCSKSRLCWPGSNCCCRRGGKWEACACGRRVGICWGCQSLRCISCHCCSTCTCGCCALNGCKASSSHSHLQPTLLRVDAMCWRSNRQSLPWPRDLPAFRRMATYCHGLDPRQDLD